MRSIFTFSFNFMITYLPGCCCVTTRKWIHHMDANETHGEKSRWKLHNDFNNFFKPWKQHPIKYQLYRHLPHILQTVEDEQAGAIPEKHALLHMDASMQTKQQRHWSVRTLDAIWRTCREWWITETAGYDSPFPHNELVHLPYIAVATNTSSREGEEPLRITEANTIVGLYLYSVFTNPIFLSPNSLSIVYTFSWEYNSISSHIVVCPLFNTTSVH